MHSALPPDAKQKPKGCTTHKYCHHRIPLQEHKLMIGEAHSMDLGLSTYLCLVWRNWRALGLPLRVIAPLPRVPWEPPSSK